MSDLLKIPHFVEGKNKLDLQRNMLKLQIDTHHKYKFFDIQFDGKKWVAWYHGVVKGVNK